MQGYIVREMEVNYKAEERVRFQLNTSEAAYDFLKPKFQHKTAEYFIVLCLDNKNVVYGWQIVSQGTVSETVVHPRDVFKAAVMTNASAVIVAHNHPSGEVEPSIQDIMTTRRLKAAGELMGIPVLDHIIIGDGYYSMRVHEQM